MRHPTSIATVTIASTYALVTSGSTDSSDKAYVESPISTKVVKGTIQLSK